MQNFLNATHFSAMKAISTSPIAPLPQRANRSSFLQFEAIADKLVCVASTQEHNTENIYISYIDRWIYKFYRYFQITKNA